MPFHANLHHLSKATVPILCARSNIQRAAIVWDNIRFMHAAHGHRIGDQRFGLRTTLAGAVHTGRYFDADAEAVTPNFVD